MACLIRSDFNYAVVFFCYFAWQNRKDRISLNLVFDSLMQVTACVVLLLIYDLLFFVLEARVWLKFDKVNPVWNRLSGLHNFAIFCSAIIFLLKLLLLYFLCRAKRIDQRSLI